MKRGSDLIFIIYTYSHFDLHTLMVFILLSYDYCYVLLVGGDPGLLFMSV